jgi:hypothetical protein
MGYYCNMFKSTLVTTYFIDFRASTDANLFEEALTTFNGRGNSDTELVDFLRSESYTLYKHKVSGVIYGSCMGVVQTVFYCVGIFEIIPLVQCYVVVDFKTGKEIKYDSIGYFHDVNTLFSIRPYDPNLGDFMYASITQDDENLIFNSQNYTSEIPEISSIITSSDETNDKMEDLPF